MKNLFHHLHEKALECVATYLLAESDLIAILREIDECRGYREIGYKSLFEYASQALKLSESVSYNLITVARKAREVGLKSDRKSRLAGGLSGSSSRSLSGKKIRLKEPVEPKCGGLKSNYLSIISCRFPKAGKRQPKISHFYVADIVRSNIGNESAAFAVSLLTITHRSRVCEGGVRLS